MPSAETKHGRFPPPIGTAEDQPSHASLRVRASGLANSSAEAESKETTADASMKASEIACGAAALVA